VAQIWSLRRGNKSKLNSNRNKSDENHTLYSSLNRSSKKNYISISPNRTNLSPHETSKSPQQNETAVTTKANTLTQLTTFGWLNSSHSQYQSNPQHLDMHGFVTPATMQKKERSSRLERRMRASLDRSLKQQSQSTPTDTV